MEVLPVWVRNLYVSKNYDNKECYTHVKHF